MILLELLILLSGGGVFFYVAKSEVADKFFNGSMGIAMDLLVSVWITLPTIQLLMKSSPWAIWCMCSCLIFYAQLAKDVKIWLKK